MVKLNEYEQLALETLKNIKRESSNDVWSALANATDNVLIAYVIDKVGRDAVLDTIKQIKSDKQSE